MSLTAQIPHLTAALNGLASLLLIAAFLAIRAKNRLLHRRLMLSALAASGLFLIFYLVYHFTQPIFVFAGQGWVRPLYYALLISHVLLAIVALPLIVLALRRALLGQFDRHKPLARVTLPIWFYVSVTGLVVYALLYHLYPPPA